jgi:hypothetical protein
MLVGLCLNIPNKWWPGFHNGGLNRGKIAAINLNPSSLYYFQVKLEEESGAHYTMHYDSVLLYLDNKQPGFSQFCLPSCSPGNPEDKVARVRVPKKLGQGCATTWRPASNQKGGHHITIIPLMGRSLLLMTLLAFLDAELCRV